ncbi:MAG TPA: hypothetical protein VIY49_04090 [Bryobacteraceae bacterium]
MRVPWKLAIIGLGAGCLMLAVTELPQKVEITKTEQMDFPSGGVLRLTNSIGYLTVEGWDEPKMEITTIKSTKKAVPAKERDKANEELDKVHVMVDHKGNEIAIDTDFPRHRAYPPPAPWGHGSHFEMEYRIKVPRDTRLIVSSHDVGEIHVEDLINDIDVNLVQGEVMLHLAEEGRYAIHATSDFGNINCDFPGEEKRRHWLTGHRWESEETAGHKLNLKVGYGDVVVLKIRVPKAPAPAAGLQSGL